MATLTGVFRLGKDAELREARDTAVVNMALAYNHGRKGSDGKRPTQWIEASLWGKRAEALAQYLVKGQQVYLHINDVHVETYEKREGGEGVKLVGIVGDVLELVGGAPGGGGRTERERDERPRREAPAPRREAAPRSSGGGFDDMDDDIPF